MFKESLLHFQTKDDFTGLLSGMTYTSDSIPLDNQWTFNTLKELHVKDASSSLFGGVTKDLYGLVIGDIIELECELLSISGVLPKIAMDGLGSGNNLGLFNTDGYAFPTNKWKSFKVKYVIQKQNDYYRVVIGTFTSDIGEYKMRNLRIRIHSQTNAKFVDSGKFTYQAGFIDVSTTFKTSVERKLDGTVTLTLNCKKADDGVFVANTPILFGNLPNGFRPKQPIRFLMMGEGATSGYVVGWIDQYGGVLCRPGVEVKNFGTIIQYPSE